MSRNEHTPPTAQEFLAAVCRLEPDDRAAVLRAAHRGNAGQDFTENMAQMRAEIENSE